MTSDTSSTKPYMNRNASNIRKYSVKLPEDEENPNITGSSFITNSVFILADSNNKCLKLFELQSTGISLIAKESLYEQPCGLDVYNENELAVALGGCRAVGRFSVVENKIKDESQIPVGFVCQDVAYINTDTLAVVGLHSAIFCVLNITNGTQLWKLEGPDFFLRPLYLTLNRAKTTAYVSDWDRNIVKTIDVTGSHAVTSTIQLAGKTEPEGITTDAEDNLYVCKFNNSSIQQISPAGDIKVFLTAEADEMYWPRTISISPDGITFLVGCDVRGIVVFNME